MLEKRVLVVEDDAGIAALVSKLASELCFGVAISNGTDIEKVYSEFRPDIIVLDLYMPEMDGLEVLQYLRKQGSTARIIILSGSADSCRRIAQNMALHCGLTIDANISKPFRIGDLRLALEKSERLIVMSRKSPVTREAATTS